MAYVHGRTTLHPAGVEQPQGFGRVAETGVPWRVTMEGGGVLGIELIYQVLTHLLGSYIYII